MTPPNEFPQEIKDIIQQFYSDLSFRINELEKRVNMRAEFVDKAALAAKEALEQRLESINAVRSSLISGNEADHKQLFERLRTVELWTSNAQGKHTQTVWIVGIVLALLQVIFFVIGKGGPTP